MATTRAQQQQAKHEPRLQSRLSKSTSGNSLTAGTTGAQSSLVYWSHSKDEENELDDAGFIVNGGGRYGDPDDYEIGSQSSLTDSLYYSEDEGGHSQVTGVVSFASSRDRDASFSTTTTSGADRYFDEPSDDNDAASLGGDSSCSSNANVYIFTDDDSLSPRDHRLASASNESRLLLFRGGSSIAADEWLNPPSLLETPGPVGRNMSPDISPLMSPGLDTPSGIVSPSSWQLYNQRKGKHVARKILWEQQQQQRQAVAATAPAREQDQRSRRAELSSSSSASSPSRQSLWRRVTTRSSVTAGRSEAAGAPGIITAPEEGRSDNHNSNARHQGRLSLVGSWEEDDEVADDGDETESIHVVNCRRGGSGWEARADARDIVELLDLGDDGHQVLDEIETALTSGFGSDADAVHMPPYPLSATSIPFWPIFHGTMWLPRYDLYVEQALRSSPAIVAA